LPKRGIEEAVKNKKKEIDRQILEMIDSDSDLEDKQKKMKNKLKTKNGGRNQQIVEKQ